MSLREQLGGEEEQGGEVLELSPNFSVSLAEFVDLSTLPPSRPYGSGYFRVRSAHSIAAGARRRLAAEGPSGSGHGD